MPIGPYFVSAFEVKEVDFIIYLHNDERQPLVDEFINKAEYLGLTVNPIYLSWADWYYETHNTDWWDLSWGGILLAQYADDISTLGFTVMGMDYYILRHDDIKLHNMAWDIWNMREELETIPETEIDDLSADMVDKFHDVEERIWEEQYLFTFIQYTDFAVHSEVAVPNCKAGHVFSNSDLRITYSSLLDRSKFIDFYSSISLPAYELFHLHQWSIYHDITLPNSMPI